MPSGHSLESLIIDSADFGELTAAMNIFCPFEAVGMSRQEVRHGHFLSYVLDPQRPHGFGSECLRAFMWAAAATIREENVHLIAPLDVHLMELDSASVRREYKGIDLLVEIPAAKVVVGIELKIEATEHSGQLRRYRETIESEWPKSDGWKHILLFLTVRGDDPSHEDGEGWYTFPLAPVANALGRIGERQVGHPQASVLLQAYVRMLRRDHLTDERMEQLARGIWREHREALEFLISRRPDAVSDLLALLLDRRNEVALSVSKSCGLQVTPDHSSRSYVRFAVEDWDEVPGMLTGTGWKSKRMLLLEVFKEPTKAGVRAEFKLGPGDPSAREHVFRTLKDAGANIGGKWGIGAGWRQLANTTLLTGNEIEASDDPYPLLAARLTDFVNTHAPSYHKALRSLLPN